MHGACTGTVTVKAAGDHWMLDDCFEVAKRLALPADDVVDLSSLP